MVPRNPAFRQKAPGIRGGVWDEAPRFFLFIFIVWTRQSVNNEYENATLLTRDALQKDLQTFIDDGVKENIEILQKENTQG